MINTHSQRCTLCDRWMPPRTLCQTVQYVCLAGMRHQLVLCMALALAMLLAACSQPIAYPPPPYEVGGVPVAYEERLDLNAPSAATWVEGLPVILWSPFQWARLSPVEQVFDLAHEACHLRDWTGGELAADCCAVRWMRRADYLPSSDLAELVSIIMDWPASDEGHPPGIERAIHIMECLDDD